MRGHHFSHCLQKRLEEANGTGLLGLLIDDLQDDAAWIPILQQRLRLEDVMSPLTRVDYRAVTQPEPEMECLTFDHWNLPFLRLVENEYDRATRRLMTVQEQSTPNLSGIPEVTAPGRLARVIETR